MRKKFQKKNPNAFGAEYKKQLWLQANRDEDPKKREEALKALSFLKNLNKKDPQTYKPLIPSFVQKNKEEKKANKPTKTILRKKVQNG